MFNSFSKDVLEKLLKYCNDEDEYNKLQKIIEDENIYEQYLTKNYNIIDLLNEFNSISVPFVDFYHLMPKIIVLYIFKALAKILHSSKFTKFQFRQNRHHNFFNKMEIIR